MRATFAFILCAAVLTGCGGMGIQAPATVTQSTATILRPDRARSWMLPEAKGEKLVYIGDGTVYVFAYGTGKLVGTLARIGNTSYECSDNDGDVFVPVVNSASRTGVYEYAHGGTTPIGYFPVPGAVACAVDPLTGNLAVINEGPTIYVFRNASGSSEQYTDKSLYLSRDIAYDSSGNLFVVGDYLGNHFALVELVGASSAFQDITVDASEEGNDQNPIAWDGQHLGLGSYRSTKRTRSQQVIQRLAISGTTATLVGQTPLGAQREPSHVQFWTNGRVAVQASNKPRQFSLLEYFRYPRGRSTARFKVHVLGAPDGIAISAAPPAR